MIQVDDATRSLAEIREGSVVWIVGIDGASTSRGRLGSMGLIPGTRLTVIRRHGRGPVLIDLDGQRLALGHTVAERIQVRPAGAGA